MTTDSVAFKYRVFISYSHRDDKWARWLHRSLERYRPPAGLADQVPSARGKPRRIAPVFRDREELPTSASLSEAVNAALKDSESLVVICSPHAAQSHWVNEEILTFKRLGRTDRIFCLVIDGEPFSGGEDECFAQALRFECAADGSLSDVPAEPLAADARASADGRTLAKLKLVAGLLGVGLDDLRQRDLQRRHHRMLAITAGSLAMTVLTLSLAISAYLSNIEAERRRAQAEDLISFLVEDLYYGLAEIGRLDVFTSVGNKAMEYFSQLADEDVDATVLQQRALALQQIGNIRLSQGATEEALESFSEALTVSRRLAALEPSNPHAQISLANSFYWIGLVHWQQGNLAEAGEMFAREIPLVDSVVSSEPNNAEWLREQAYAYTNYARVLELQGQLVESLELYESIAKISQQLWDMEPGNRDYQLEVGFAHNNLGKVLQSMGRIKEARRHYDQDYQIKYELLQSDPNHNLWRYYLAKSQAFIGRNRAAVGEYGECAAAYREALDIVESLHSMEPGQTAWQGDLATFAQELATVELNHEQYNEAERLLQLSLESWEELLAIEDGRVRWQSGQGLAWVHSARLSLLKGDPANAEQWAVRALNRLQAVYQSAPGNLDNLKYRVLAGLVLGDTEQAKDRDAATANWQESLDILARSPVASINPEHLELRAALLSRLGQLDQAAKDLARLDDMHYDSSLVNSPRDRSAGL